MPRLVTTLAVWIAVIFSIGFNITRYPIVWEMMAASASKQTTSSTATVAKADAPAPQDKTLVGASVQRSAGSGAAAAADRTASSQVGAASSNQGTCRVQCDGNTCKIVPIKSPQTPAELAAQEAAPAARYASAQPAQNSEIAAQKDRALVPVVGNGAPQAAPDTTAHAPGSPSPGGKVRHLPPLTEESTSPAALPENAAIHSIPLYARTGMD